MIVVLAVLVAKGLYMYCPAHKRRGQPGVGDGQTRGSGPRDRCQSSALLQQLSSSCWSRPVRHYMIRVRMPEAKSFRQRIKFSHHSFCQRRKRAHPPRLECIELENKQDDAVCLEFTAKTSGAFLWFGQLTSENVSPDRISPGPSRHQHDHSLAYYADATSPTYICQQP